MTEIKLPLTIDAVEELCKVAQRDNVEICIRLYSDNTDIDIEPAKGDSPAVKIDTTMYP